MVLVFSRVFAVKKPFCHFHLKQKVAIQICIAIWVIPLLCITSLYISVRFSIGMKQYDKYGDILFPVMTYPVAIVFILCYWVIKSSLKLQEEVVISQADPHIINAYQKMSRAIQNQKKNISIQNIN